MKSATFAILLASSGSAYLVRNASFGNEVSLLADFSLSGAVNFGKDLCPCVGFHGIDGKTPVTIDGAKVNYPADLGATCQPWDKENHPKCKADGAPWCGDKWCYVDPKACHLGVIPKPSAYMPDAVYQGMPVFYSYATCGAADQWAKGLPVLGEARCRCTGFQNAPGETIVDLGKGKTMPYPADIGGECLAWDNDRHPDCKGGDANKKPTWCNQAWCFVDPCSCDIEVPPKQSMYLPKAGFQNRPVYYSYATCNQKDSFSSDEHIEESKKEAERICAKETTSNNANPKFGTHGCACIGFHDISGETTLTIKGAKTAYPADLGSYCHTWDDGHHPECPDGKFCKDKWCYVDPKECRLPTVPKVSAYMPDAKYQGLPIYYSYATCGYEDQWAKNTPNFGAGTCRCVGVDNAQGTMKVKIGDNMMDYPAELGGACEAWDSGRHPDCKGGKGPAWCEQQWCFVDPCACMRLEAPPKQSVYLPTAQFQGHPVYYSYATCGGKDEFSSEEHKQKSVDQINSICSGASSSSLLSLSLLATVLLFAVRH